MLSFKSYHRFKMTACLLALLSCMAGSEEMVYVCDSAGARKYHVRTDCRGLKNCKHQVIIISLEKATQSGKTKCGWETQ